MTGFGDLNIIWNASGNMCSDNVRTAVELGYKILAINNFVEELSVKTSKKVKDKVATLTTSQEIKAKLTDSAGKQVAEQLYTRFTAVMSDMSQSIRLKDQVIQDYDIIAIQPTTPKVFQEACKTYNIDLISLDLSQRLDGMLSGKSAHAAIGCALTRGIHFEIVYAPMIRDSSARRMTIANASRLIEICRGKNIVVSSGCQKALDLRGPYDVTNLALLFEISEEMSKHTVLSNVHSLLSHAASRKSANGVVSCVRSSPDSKLSIDNSEEQEISEPRSKKKKLGSV